MTISEDDHLGQQPPPRPLSPATTALLHVIGEQLARRRWRGSNEGELQVAIATVLAGLAAPAAFDPEASYPRFVVEREHRLDGKSRVDFAIVMPDQPAPNVIAIEVKVAGGTVETLRQIQRYAAHPSVAAVVLATTAARHAAATPTTFGGVRIFATILRRF